MPCHAMHASSLLEPAMASLPAFCIAFFLCDKSHIRIAIALRPARTYTNLAAAPWHARSSNAMIVAPSLARSGTYHHTPHRQPGPARPGPAPLSSLSVRSVPVNGVRYASATCTYSHTADRHRDTHTGAGLGLYTSQASQPTGAVHTLFSLIKTHINVDMDWTGLFVW